MTTEAKPLTDTQPIPTTLPEGFIPFDHFDTNAKDKDTITPLFEDVLAQAPTEPIFIAEPSIAVANPETSIEQMDVATSEHAPKGDVLIYRDDVNKFYAVIRGFGKDGLDKKAAEHAESTLASYVQKNAAPDGGSDYALELMTEALDSIDDVIDTNDEGVNHEPRNGKEINYEISAIHIVEDDDGSQRAIYGQKGKGLIIQDDFEADEPEYLSLIPDNPEHATEYYEGFKPRVIGITEPLAPNTRFVLATESIKNLADNGHSQDDFIEILAETERQEAADSLLDMSMNDKTADAGRATIVIDTLLENDEHELEPDIEEEEQTEVLRPTVTEQPSKKTVGKRLLQLMGGLKASYSAKREISSDAAQNADQARTARAHTTGRNLGNLLKLSPVLITNKLSGFYSDPEHAKRHKRETIAAAIGVVAVGVFALLESHSGVSASHHIREVHQHVSTHKLPTAPKVPKDTSTFKAGYHPHTPGEATKAVATPQAAAQAPAQPAAANTAPTAPAYTNQPLASGSNPWDVARQSLQNSGNAAPTNAQIMAQDNLIMAANHLTPQQATELPAGFVLRVPPVN